MARLRGAGETSPTFAFCAPHADEYEAKGYRRLDTELPGQLRLT